MYTVLLSKFNILVSQSQKIQRIFSSLLSKCYKYISITKILISLYCIHFLQNYEKHASRVSQVIAAVAKVSCKHGLWLVARVNQKISLKYFILEWYFCLIQLYYFLFNRRNPLILFPIRFYITRPLNGQLWLYILQFKVRTFVCYIPSTFFTILVLALWRFFTRLGHFKLLWYSLNMYANYESLYYFFGFLLPRYFYYSLFILPIILYLW